MPSQETNGTGKIRPANRIPSRVGQFVKCTRLLVTVVCCFAVIGAARADVTREYLIKAAFLYNFAKFVDWPGEVFTGADEPFVFCIAGDAALEAANEALAGKTIKDRQIRVVRFSATTQSRHCHILFLSTENGRNLFDRVRLNVEHPTLTVSDRREIAESGVIVNLMTVENKIRFDVNNAAARRAGLQISARLLKLARSVSN